MSWPWSAPARSTRPAGARSPSSHRSHLAQRPLIAFTGGLGRALADVDHVRDAVLALAGLAAGAAQRPSGAQTAREVAAQRSARLHVERLIDRLGRHPQLWVIGELAAQPTGDLLGRVAPLQIFLDLPAQRQVGGELGGLGSSGALIRQRMRRRRTVRLPGAAGVTSQLAADRRRAAPQPGRDRSHRLTTSAPERDLLAIGERQAAALEIPTTTRSHPAGGDQPASALLAIRAGLGRGIGDELAARHRGPEPLHDLGDHLVREPRHRHAPSVAQRWPAGMRRPPPLPETLRGAKGPCPLRVRAVGPRDSPRTPRV